MLTRSSERIFNPMRYAGEVFTQFRYKFNIFILYQRKRRHFLCKVFHYYFVFFFLFLEIFIARFYFKKLSAITFDINSFRYERKNSINKRRNDGPPLFIVGVKLNAPLKHPGRQSILSY